MGWLGARATDRAAVYNPNGLEAGAYDGKVPARLLSSGTIVVETFFPDAFEQPLDLIDFERWDGERRSIHFLLGPNGRLWCATEKGTTLSVMSLDLSHWSKQIPIRLLYEWDCRRGKQFLGAENLETGALAGNTADRPVPLREDDLARCLYAHGTNAVSDAVGCFAFSDRCEPIGYSDGIDGDALVETEHGPLSPRYLKVGTLVRSYDGDLVPLVGMAHTTLPTFGEMRGLHLRRPFQKLRAGLRLGRRAQIVTDGADASYLFGADRLTTAALHVAPFVRAPQDDRAFLATRYALVLEAPAAFDVNGIGVLPVIRVPAPRGDILHRHSSLAHVPLSHVPLPHADHPATLLAHEAQALFSARYR